MFSNIYEKYKDYFIIQKYKKNDLIFNELEECNYVGYVKSGQVHIYTATYSEKEYTITNIDEGNIFGQFILFSEYNRFLGNIICYKASEIALISKDKLLSILVEDKEVLEEYLMELSKISIKSQQKVKILSQKSIRDKIMFYLFDTAKQKNSNIIRIKSKEQLALMLNIPRPSLSRELINLRNEKIIEFDRHEIIIKKAL